MIRKILIYSKFARDGESPDLNEEGKNLLTAYTATIALERFILSGVYTQRKNKEFILKNCLLLTPSEIAESLGIQPQSVRAIQKEIYADLVKEIGDDVLDLIQEKQYTTIGHRIDYSNQRLENNNQIIFKNVTDIAYEHVKNIDYLNDQIQQLSTQLREELKIKQTIKNSTFKNEFQYLQVYSPLYCNTLFNNIDPVKFLTILSILEGDTGSIDLRNKIQKDFIRL
ncbi:hypothetical protein ACYSNO_06705 [Enterococcus sp. LJL98]